MINPHDTPVLWALRHDYRSLSVWIATSSILANFIPKEKTVRSQLAYICWALTLRLKLLKDQHPTSRIGKIEASIWEAFLGLTAKHIDRVMSWYNIAIDCNALLACNWKKGIISLDALDNEPNKSKHDLG